MKMMMNLNVESQENNQLSALDKELQDFKKYLKYRRKGQINNGNYNWLVIDPSLSYYFLLVEKIEKYVEFDDLMVNVIKDIDFYTLKNDFSEMSLLSAIKNKKGLAFKNLSIKSVVNIIVISQFPSDVAKNKFGKYCTFLADLSTEEFTNSRNNDLINNIRLNNFYIENQEIINTLNELDNFEADRVITKAEIKALNNKTSILDDYICIKKSNKANNYISELNQLIGQEKAKKTIIEIVNYLKIAKIRNDIPCLNMAFLGDSGTGKTTIARIVGHILSELKILGTNAPFIETSREQLVGRYIGQTESNVLEAVNNAIGGVLFIDEAYSLTSDSSKNDFGSRALDVLVNQLEIHKNNLCVIFAGYHDIMLDFLKVNPGLDSRIPFKIEFDNYSEEELYMILNSFIKKINLKLQNGTKKLLLEHFKKVKNIKDFGNGRYIRNFVERLKIKQANRIVKEKNSDINLITKTDIENTIEDMKKLEKRRMRIGF